MKKVSPISLRLDGVSESATIKLNTAVQAMKSKGINVINLTAGEPDFDAPKQAKDAVVAAVLSNKSKYTPAAGIQDLRDLIAKKTNLQQPEITNAWKSSNVVVSNGGKQALFNSFLCLLDEGDGVLIPSPFWVSYPEMVKLAGGEPIFAKTSFENGFKLTPDDLRDLIEKNKNIKILVLNSPSNPTGSMYTKEEFKALGRVLMSPAAEKIWVISDEIYDLISLSENPFSSFLGACPELQDRTITVNGLSKSAAMTGWRVGWTVAGSEVTQAIITLQGQSTSGINSLAQYAAIAALKVPESDFSEQLEAYRRRRDLAVCILKEAEKLKIFIPEGAFYVFVGIGSYLKEGEDSMSFCERLLESQKVAVVPGTPFGEPNSIRLSFATDEASIVEGCRSILKFLDEQCQ